MPMSTCIKCGGHTFEVVEAKPGNSDFTLMFVQCSSCGGVVGVMDYLNKRKSPLDILLRKSPINWALNKEVTL